MIEYTQKPSQNGEVFLCLVSYSIEKKKGLRVKLSENYLITKISPFRERR
jgi:hypothetical protein